MFSFYSFAQIFHDIHGSLYAQIGHDQGFFQFFEEVFIDFLSPVYLYDKHDTMEDVKAIGAVLKGLEDKGLMSLDYDMPIHDFDYVMYTNSDLYAYFVDTIAEAKGREGFLCDRAQIELGSMAVTDLGEQVCAREE